MIREEFRESYRECLAAVGRSDLEHKDLQQCVRDLRARFQNMWGLPPYGKHELIGMFLSEDRESSHPRDLCLFSQTHFMVAVNFMSPRSDLRVYSLENRVIALRMLGGEPPAERAGVTVWLDNGIKVEMWGSGENATLLAAVVDKHLVRNLR